MSIVQKSKRKDVYRVSELLQDSGESILSGRRKKHDHGNSGERWLFRFELFQQSIPQVHARISERVQKTAESENVKRTENCTVSIEIIKV